MWSNRFVQGMVRIMRIILLSVWILFCASCGYRPVTAAVPGDGRAVFVPLVENKTPYASLSAPMTSVLRQRLAASGVEVVLKGAGAARLLVVILQVDGAPGMLGTQGDHLVPVDTLWRMVAEARVVEASGKAIVGPTRFEVEGRSFAQGGSPLAEESLGQRARTDLLDELADAIVSQLFEK